MNKNKSFPDHVSKRYTGFLLCCFLAAMPIITQAAPDGFYANAGLSISDGPGTVSINQSSFGNNVKYADGNPISLFTLPQDGRFKYNFSLGYTLRNLALELKYIDLGTQKLLGINGANLAEGASGGFKSEYYGINGVSFIPVNNNVDFFVSMGVGKLHTKMKVSDPKFFMNDSPQEAKQSETVLLLGAGLRYYFSPEFSVNAEYNRLTPVTHGLANSGTYNTAFNIFSLGLTYTF